MSTTLLGRRGGGKANSVYTPEQRATYVRRARQWLAHPGTTVAAAAEKLGLNPGTLYGWLRQPEVGAFLPVAVVSETTALIETDADGKPPESAADFRGR